MHAPLSYYTSVPFMERSLLCPLYAHNIIIQVLCQAWQIWSLWSQNDVWTGHLHIWRYRGDHVWHQALHYLWGVERDVLTLKSVGGRTVLELCGLQTYEQRHGSFIMYNCVVTHKRQSSRLGPVRSWDQLLAPPCIWWMPLPSSCEWVNVTHIVKCLW